MRGKSVRRAEMSVVKGAGVPAGDRSNRLGRQAAIVIAASGVVWIAAEAIGAQQGWSNRTLGLFNLAALAGFGAGIWLAFQAWQLVQYASDSGWIPHVVNMPCPGRVGG